MRTAEVLEDPLKGQAESAVELILSTVEGGTSTNVDVSSIISQCDVLENIVKEASLSPSNSPDLYGDWRMVWASSDDALSAVGSGLHRVAMTRLEDIFVSLGDGGTLETNEVLRVIGPFPNVRNTLTGSVPIKEDWDPRRATTDKRSCCRTW